LGILYLLHSDLELANQAFKTAQSIDPDYIPAWVGQAYVANLWGRGNDEAVELFEHSYEISGGGYFVSLIHYNYLLKNYYSEKKKIH